MLALLVHHNIHSRCAASVLQALTRKQAQDLMALYQAKVGGGVEQGAGGSMAAGAGGMPAASAASNIGGALKVCVRTSVNAGQVSA